MKNTESIKKNNDFKKVFTRGKWIRGKYVVIYFLRNNSDLNNLGIAVSKKTGSSVERNRIKRLIRECYRLNESTIDKGKNIIILWKSSEKDVRFAELEKDIIEIFNKSGLRRKNE
ncbi:MAG: ribonuclease P protein component [Ignavibacteriales bacterium]